MLRNRDGHGRLNFPVLGTMYSFPAHRLNNWIQTERRQLIYGGNRVGKDRPSSTAIVSIAQ